METIKIGDKIIGNGFPAFIVAELSGNHCHDFEKALQIIKAAKESGADAVKLQTYTADTITINSRKEHFIIKGGTLWDGKTLYDQYKIGYTPWEWQPKLKKYAESIGLICFSSPFDKTAVDFLEKMDVPAYKVASFEMCDIPLIEYIASKGKPVIMSTGMGNMEEIKEAVDACIKMGNDQIALLKCNSAYPAPVEETNLLTIPDMIKRFNVVAGLSDHTMSSAVPVAAVSLGASIVEKHFTFTRSWGGPDAAFSIEPSEMSEMVRMIRDAEKALGGISYEIPKSAESSRVFMRSLFAAEDIKTGEEFTEKNVMSKRPGVGLKPKYLSSILGKRAKRNIEKGDPMSWDLIESE